MFAFLWKNLYCRFFHKNHKCYPEVHIIDSKKWHCTKCHPCDEELDELLSGTYPVESRKLSNMLRRNFLSLFVIPFIPVRQHSVEDTINQVLDKYELVRLNHINKNYDIFMTQEMVDDLKYFHWYTNHINNTVSKEITNV